MRDKSMLWASVMALSLGSFALPAVSYAGNTNMDSEAPKTLQRVQPGNHPDVSTEGAAGYQRPEYPPGAAYSATQPPVTQRHSNPQFYRYRENSPTGGGTLTSSAADEGTMGESRGDWRLNSEDEWRMDSEAPKSLQRVQPGNQTKYYQQRPQSAYETRGPGITYPVQ